MTLTWAAAHVSAVLLAAGQSRRMGGGRDKLLLPYEGQTLLERAVKLISGLPLKERILVTTRDRLDKITVAPDITVILNPRPRDGQSGSLRLGAAAAAGSHFMFLAADQPRLSEEELLRLINAARKNPGMIIYPQVRGVPTGPAIFPSSFRGELMELSGDTGGRQIRKSHPEACFAVSFDSPDAFADVDTWEDYVALTKKCHK